MTVTNRKSKGKAKASSNNAVGISTRETEKDVASLTSSEEEESVFAADTCVPPTSKTQSSKQYLKPYGELMVNFSQLAEEIIEQPMKLSVKKQKELWYVKALWKGCVGPSTPFCFDVIVQLANIPARITLYELLRLYKSTRDALKRSFSKCRGFHDPDSCYM